LEVTVVIVAENITKLYGERAALSGVSFEVGEHQVVGFLGLNGAGKSTMLKILCGLLLPSSGRTLVHGVDGVADPMALRRLIGFLPDRPPLYGEMRVDEMLRYAASLRGFDGRGQAARIDEVVALCGLKDVRRQAVETLSHGYKQRVGIAQAIVHAPKLVVLDEPITGLDPAQIVAMRTLIADLRTKHTVLLSSHVLGEIGHTCDRLLVLHGGRIVAQGSPADMSSQQRFLEMRVVGEASLVRAALNHVDKKRLWDVDVHAQDGLQLVRAQAAQDDVADEVVAALVSANLGVRGMKLSGTGLEDVFLRLTGGQGEVQ
jgi:ABC-2 type transport system ATP-binding protein